MITVVSDIKTLKGEVLSWLEINDINPYNFKMISSMDYMDIDFKYFGDSLSAVNIRDFEDIFNVEKEYENVELLDYKNYDSVKKEYVDLSNCQYVFRRMWCS